MAITEWQIIPNKLVSIEVEMFKRGLYDFITEHGGVRHEKQEAALRILTDNDHSEFLYGGAAGGAKSWTGASWEIFMALSYPGTRYFVGRNELKDLRESTSVTFNKVFRAYHISRDYYNYNGTDHYYQFYNGSRIDFVSLRREPSDPFFEGLGSKEYTSGWIEEMSL